MARPRESGQNASEAGLSGTVRACHGQYLPCGGHERDVAKDLPAVEGDAQVAQLEDGTSSRTRTWSRKLWPHGLPDVPEPPGEARLVGKGQHLLPRDLSLDPTPTHQQEAVRDVHEVGQAVLGDQDRHAPLLQLPQGAPQSVRRRDVQVGRGLVQGHEGRVRSQRGGYRHLLLLTAGEAVVGHPPQRVERQLLDRPVCELDHAIVVVAQVFAGEGYLSRKLAREELGRGVLEHASHELCALPLGESLGRMTRQHDLSPAVTGVVPSRQAVHQADDGGLTAARWTAEHHALACGDVQAHSVDGPGRPPVRKRDVPQGEDLLPWPSHDITPFATIAPTQATRARAAQARSSAPAGRW